MVVDMNSKEYFKKIDEMLYHYFDLTLKKEIAAEALIYMASAGLIMKDMSPPALLRSGSLLEL